MTNAAVDLHRDDPAFGYRFISDEIEAEAGLAGFSSVRACNVRYGAVAVLSYS